jgi:anti-sigma-K factor RskA
MTHEEIQADLALLALGTLDPDERRHLEEHLAGGCAACAQELSVWREVVGLLPLAADEADTPNLKPLLLRRLRPGRATVMPFRRRMLIPLAAAAGALLAVGIVRDAQLRSRLRAERATVMDLQAQLSEAYGRLDRVAAALREREGDAAKLRSALVAAEESLAILQSRGLRLARLAQTPDAQPAEAHVLISTATGRALFYAFDLQPVSADRVYELWWITEKEGPVNAGLFQIDARGLGRLETTVPADLGPIEAAAVTIEPAGGREKPSGPMVLLGSLKAS